MAWLGNFNFHVPIRIGYLCLVLLYFLISKRLCSASLELRIPIPSKGGVDM